MLLLLQLLLHFATAPSSLDFSNEDIFLPKQTHPDQHPMKDFPAMATSVNEYTIMVKRLSSFYLLNLVIPILLLSILSWTSFALKPSSIDVRLSTTMTILLALIAFQIIINEALPKTGELTRLHKYILASNIMIVLAGLESMVVYWLYENDIGSLKVYTAWLCGSKRSRGAPAQKGKEQPVKVKGYCTTAPRRPS